MSRQSKSRRKAKRDLRRKKKTGGHVSAKPKIPVRSAPIDLTVPKGITVESLFEKTGNWPDKMLIDVGEAMHRGRTIEPILEEEAPEGSTYDDRIGIQYAPLKIETCGFHITAKLRRIGVGEVATYAKSSCRVCKGIGRWKVTRMQEHGRDDIGRKIMQPVEYEQACSCAESRYKKKHKNFLVDTQLGEWIALDELEITKLPSIEVGGISTGVASEVPKVLQDKSDDELLRSESVPELSAAGG